MWFSCWDLPVRAWCSICSFALDTAVYSDPDWTKSLTHSKDKEMKSLEKLQLFLFPPFSKHQRQSWTHHARHAVVMVLFTRSHSGPPSVAVWETSHWMCRASNWKAEWAPKFPSPAFMFSVLVCNWLTTTQERPTNRDTGLKSTFTGSRRGLGGIFTGSVFRLFFNMYVYQDTVDTTVPQ